MGKKYNSYLNSFRLLKICWEKQKITTTFLCFFTFLQSLLPVISVTVLQNMINSISTNNLTGSYKFFAFYCCVLILGKIIGAGVGYYTNIFSIRIAKDINLDVMEKSLSLRLQDYEDSETYDSLKRALDETQRPSETFILMVSALGSATTFLSYVTVLTAWKWFLLPVFLITPIISFYFILNLGKYEFQVKQERTIEQRRVNYYSYILNNDITFKENKILNICNYIYTRYKDKYDSFAKKDTYIARKKSYQQLLFRILESLIGCFVIAMVINSAIQGTIKIGSVYAFITAIWGIISSVDNIATNIASLMKNNLYIENLFSFLEKQDTYKNSSKVNNQKKIIIRDIKTIEFISVSFRYKQNLPYALKNVSFDVKKGDKVAVIGKNGSGKSTVIKLLCGFYDSYEGDILINGCSLRDIDIESYQKQLGAVFQDYSRYSFTLKENLDLANISSKENVDVSSKLNEMNNNGLLNYITKLPHGINTQLGYIFENGVQLSGGEWQQLAIARSLMKNTDLYILDEPCSSLDLESENKIYKYLKQLSHEKICLLVSHRLHNILNFADSVMVFQRGELVENDSVDNLLNKDSIFREKFFKLETSKEYFQNKGVKYGDPN